MSRPTAQLIRPMSRTRFALVALVLIIAALLAGLLTRAYVQRYLVEDAAARGASTLDFHAQAFAGALDKYRILPALLARRSDVRAMIRGAAMSEMIGSGSTGGASPSGALLSEHAALTGAYALVVSDADGRVIASSLDDRASFAANGNLAGQRHFDVARDGRLGRQTIVAANNRRLYLFSSAVRSGNALLGVVSVAVDLERLEQPWTLTRDIVFAYQADGLIVLSNQPALRLRKRIYGPHNDGDDAQALFIDEAGPGPLVRVGHAGLEGRYVMSQLPVTILGWTMMDLADAGPITRRASVAGGLAGMACLLLAAMVMAVLQRRRNLAQKLRDDRASSLRLERLVRDRTRDLGRARDELLQATKLAALGQMSAAIAHEFNQPLAAIVSNADNAETLIRRGHADKAVDNLERVRGLVDRLGTISRALKTFARKPRSQLRAVSMNAAVDAALMVLQPRQREAGIAVGVEMRNEHVMVLAGAVRLEQVIVNLVANAIDAVLERHPGGGGDVRVSVSCDETCGEISVRDNGPGISVSPKEAVFDPFVTTKEGGDGLGLGLSITYNIVKDFNATIGLDSTLGGGTTFRVRVPLATNGTADRVRTRLPADA